MKRMLFIATIISVPSMHAMQMGKTLSKQESHESSCADTCCDITKKGFYLGAACCIIATSLPASAQPTYNNGTCHMSDHQLQRDFCPTFNNPMLHYAIAPNNTCGISDRPPLKNDYSALYSYTFDNVYSMSMSPTSSTSVIIENDPAANEPDDTIQQPKETTDLQDAEENFALIPDNSKIKHYCLSGDNHRMGDDCRSVSGNLFCARMQHAMQEKTTSAQGIITFCKAQEVKRDGGHYDGYRYLAMDTNYIANTLKLSPQQASYETSLFLEARLKLLKQAAQKEKQD